MKEQFISLLDKFKLPIALSFLGLVLMAGGILTSNIQRHKDFPKESLIQVQKIISVDVSGAVSKPGVYQLKEGFRIEQAIQAAGGFTNSANQEYISKYLNLAQKLVDGSKVYVPAYGETGVVVTSGAVSGANTQAKININISSQAELEALPGIGPVTASKIISGRPYQTIEELLNKKIVSKAVFEKIKDLVIIY